MSLLGVVSKAETVFARVDVLINVDLIAHNVDVTFNLRLLSDTRC
jgi:hypothetical protein